MLLLLPASPHSFVRFAKHRTIDFSGGGEKRETPLSCIACLCVCVHVVLHHLGFDLVRGKLQIKRQKQSFDVM